MKKNHVSRLTISTAFALGLGLALSSTLHSPQASAQSSSASVSGTSSAQQSSSWTSTISPIAKFESFNSSGRKGDLENRNGAPKMKIFQNKNEFSLGAKMKSGWGGFVKMVRTSTAYNDTNKNKWSDINDSSVTLIHPAWVEGSDYKLTGYIRQYIPDSEWSRKNTITHTAYYLFLTANLSPGLELFNQATPRNFSQPVYKSDHTRFVFEDRTSLSYSLGNNWFAGAGQWTQFEKHNRTADGYSVEAYPMVDYKPTKNLAVGGKIYFPVFAQNVVYDGPSNADLNNAWAELSLTLAM